MEIDLKKVLLYSGNLSKNRAQMRAIIQDIYPGKTRDMNILLNVYESGILKEIKKSGEIKEAQYKKYINKIVDEYGMKEEMAIEALDTWLKVYDKQGEEKKDNTLNNKDGE